MMVVAFYLLTLVVMTLSTLRIFQIADASDGKEWSIAFYVWLVFTFSYWLGVLT